MDVINQIITFCNIDCVILANEWGKVMVYCTYFTLNVRALETVRGIACMDLKNSPFDLLGICSRAWKKIIQTWVVGIVCSSLEMPVCGFLHNKDSGIYSDTFWFSFICGDLFLVNVTGMSVS